MASQDDRAAIQKEFYRFQIQSRHARPIQALSEKWASAPRDVLVLIFSLLDSSSALAIRRVCRLWEWAISHASIELRGGSEERPLSAAQVSKLLVLFPKAESLYLRSCAPDACAGLSPYPPYLKLDCSGVTDPTRVLRELEKAELWEYILQASDWWLHPGNIQGKRYFSPTETEAIRAGALCELGRPEEALPLYLNVCKNDFRDVSAMNNVGVCYQKLGQHENAVEYFKRALDPMHYMRTRGLKFSVDVFAFNLVVSLYELKKYSEIVEAKKHFGKSLPTEALFYIARAHESLGNIDEAIALYERKKGTLPPDAEKHYHQLTMKKGSNSKCIPS